MDLKLLDSMVAPRTIQRFDSLAAFVENELKDVIPQMYDRLFPELDARQHVPISANINPGAMSWAYDSFDKAGQAEFLAAGGTDMPRADVSKERFTFPIKTTVLAYGWTIEEIEASRFAGMQLDRMKAEAARRGQAEKEHDILLNGDLSHNLPGFLTNVRTPFVAVPNGTWASATADDILEDLNFVIDEIWVGSERVHRPNTILLPLAQLRRIQTLRIPDTGKSVIEFFMESNPFIQEILPLTELATAGVSGGARMMAYEKRPDRLTGVVPLPFEQMEPQIQGMEVIVPTRQRIGGCVWYYPLAAAFGDGI